MRVPSRLTPGICQQLVDESFAPLSASKAQALPAWTSPFPLVLP